MPKRILRPLAVGWAVFAHICGIGVVSGLAGFGIVQAVSGDNAVVIASEIRGLNGEDLKVTTLKVKKGGRYGYVYDYDRREACPGYVVILFTSLDTKAPAVVMVRKPAVLLQPKMYDDVRIDNELPPSITEGFWAIKTSLVSRCPNREQTDDISDFMIEVTP